MLGVYLFGEAPGGFLEFRDGVRDDVRDGTDRLYAAGDLTR